MALTKTKVITIGEHRYQISRFSPDLGAFLLSWLLTASSESTRPRDQNIPMQEPVPDAPKLSGEQIVRGAALAAIFNGKDFERQSFTQSKCLSICARVETIENQEVLSPILNLQGGWLLMDVRDDLALVMKLQMETLVFNFASFFDQNALGALVEDPASMV